MKKLDKLISQLSRYSISESEILHRLRLIPELDCLDELGIDILKTLGLPLVHEGSHMFTLSTRTVNIKEQKFCFVDIETNGSKPNESQIVEIGAVVVENGVEKNRFESLIYCENFPENIAQLTGINPKELLFAPSQNSVLEKFRLFLSDFVFVAHNVDFDYAFVSHAMAQAGFGPLLNRKLCTIDLAQRTIQAQRFGLSYLREFLGFNDGVHHRAIWDAISAHKVFEASLKNIPEDILTTEELISFSRSNQKKAKELRSVGQLSQVAQ